MKKIISILIILLILNFIIGAKLVYADDIDGVIQNMSTASTITGEDSKVATTINDVIGVLQVVGTGISVIVVTILGIKYMLASPSEKADTKKMIMPILIGCVLVFGGVNLVAAMADLATTFK